ncbi:hypothetical protein C8J57DRAFT_1243324 [Mycena rebaudengoi]|nr:hypothetical protein C8J57DRAFT_1243324 [Mycena rebaudengoi]
MSPPAFDAHAVVFTGGLWGHTRPMCAFAARLVKARPGLVVSFLATPAVLQKAQDEVSRFFDAEGPRDSIRFHALPAGVDFFNGDLEGVADDFARAYEALLADEQMQIPFPSVFVAEMSMPAAHDIVRARSRGITKIIAWCPVSLPFVASALRACGDAPVAEVIRRLKDAARAQGKSYREVADDFFVKSLKGEVYSLPDLPPMVDYALFPQRLEDELFLYGELVLGATLGFMHADGAICVCARALEPQTCAWAASVLAARKGASVPVLADPPSPFFALGPLMPGPTEDASQAQRAGEFAQAEDEARDVAAFLERMGRERGKGSVLYISFGSIFQPYEPPKFWAFLEAVVQLGIPFILSNLGTHAPLPPHLLAAVDESAPGAIGFQRKWLPQQYILAHPATGWFLTHCGVNSTLESLAAGVPMICWPFEFDQPTLAILVAQVLGCGFELAAVRCGLGRQHGAGDVKAEALAVLRRAFFGAEGTEARENALRVAARLARAWDAPGDGEGEGGEALRDLGRFIEEYLPSPR